MKSVVQVWIEEALKPLREQVEKLENDLEKFESTDFASHDHYHDELASADHVERSEHSFNSQLYQIKNDLSNLEYRVSDAEHKAEQAQRSADSASRNSGGRGYW